MKNIILAILICVTYSTFAQDKAKETPKIVYTHLVIYRVYKPAFIYDVYAKFTPEKEGWITYTKGFESFEKMDKWLNYEDDNGTPTTRLKEDELISIYDLTKCKETKIKFEVEEKIKEEKIIVKQKNVTERRIKL